MSEESSDSEVEEWEFGNGEEDEDDSAEMSVALPTSDDPLNLFALPDSSPMFVRNKKPRPRQHSGLALSP